ncbi:type IV secretory system conjugative DNA transfer family protein [Pseudoclavibacter helvolus]|uniref:type IV secretory system conjugative DNA transfer family protein n=1 Tax=Pseudoclavibacter helvolus TaxID=255205 RepID=UPI0024ACB36D|nr:TraM recognition domain-containing protein [Pseudoclavibacter helvolus]
MMTNRDYLTMFGFFAAALAVFLGAVHLGALLTPTGVSYAWNPIVLALEFVKGAPWPPASLVLAIVFGVAASALLWFVLTRTSPRQDVGRRKLRTNAAARRLQTKERSRELEALHPGVDIPAGQRLGRSMQSPHDWILQGWRDLCVCIFGPGRGKTSSQVIRKMLEAPGAAVMTSNKIDGMPEILAGRSDQPVYVFDPQNITGELGAPHAFRFNPLSQLVTLADALELAGIFEASSRMPDQRGDPQFDTMGRGLLAGLFLAAAYGKLPMSTAYAWLTRSDVHDAMDLLREHGFNSVAESVQGVMDQPDKTRGSVFATAQRMALPLMDDSLTAWTVDSDPGVRVFDPSEFLRSKSTLLLASKEGAGSGRAFVAALVRAVCKAGEQQARVYGGRLPVPLVMELDECANIVRWPELPSLYSFYGSIGIILSSYFQSAAQGIEAFGREGWKTLWDAAGIRIYGGGSADKDWLGDISGLIGDYDAQTYSTSYGRGGGSRSTQTQRRARLSVSDLASLPEWQALVLPGKGEPVLMQTVPWWKDKALAARIEGGKS